MDNFGLVKVALLLVGGLLILAEIAQAGRQNKRQNISMVFLAALAAMNILFMVVLWFNHLNFPLNLDVMEGTVLQHFQRAISFQPIYPEPTANFVPLAYNPLYYVVAIPFGWVFGVNLMTLRLVSILAMVGSGLILYLVVQKRTSSIGWGLLAAGLFAAAYAAMDSYLDNAHSDSLFVFFALLGTLAIDRNRSHVWNGVGILLLVASFWTKQHGALFVIGGVLFLAWREGLLSSIPYWLIAALAGPGLYLTAGPALFGSHFLYFTWDVPRAWTEFNRYTPRRYLSFIAGAYPMLALSSVVSTLWTALPNRKGLSVWHFQLVFAMLTGLMGALDPGSSDNVFIPMGVFLILMGTLGLYELSTYLPVARRWRLHLFALLASFVVLLYNPISYLVSPQADKSFDDLVAMLNGLNGSVYAPSLGQLQRGFTLSPTAHWVALEDMIRGPGRDEHSPLSTQALLEPLTHPNGPAYILANLPLVGGYPWFEFLDRYYVLQTDFGDRFKPLSNLPKRFDHGFPRYLYRYQPSAVSAQIVHN